MESINNQVQSVRQLLAIPQLAIPSYQRPYRWGSKNISDLFTDLATHQDKSAYRLGSVVFHQHTDSEQGEMLDIVEAVKRFGIDFNILHGQIDEVQGQGFASLTLLANGSQEALDGALGLLREHNVTVEELNHVL